MFDNGLSPIVNWIGPVMKINYPTSSIVHYIISNNDLQQLSSNLRNKLNNKSGNYSLIKDDSLVYTGESDRLYSRLMNHVGKKDFKYCIVTISESNYSLSTIRRDLEDKIIKNYNPKYNSASGRPSNLSPSDKVVLNNVYREIESIFRLQQIVPNPLVINTSNSNSIEDLKYELINSPYKSGYKQKNRGLITDMGLKSGEVLIFTLDRNITVKVSTDDLIEVSGRGQVGYFTLTNFVNTYKKHMLAKQNKLQSNNSSITSAGPDYFEKLDGTPLSKL